MIYIFDDRAQRRTDNEQKLSCFSDCLCFTTIDIIPGKPIEDTIVDHIENPECIIFHKSYVFNDREVTVETIRQMFIDFKIPIVIFSGGTEGSSKGSDEVYNMNANLMYDNLPYFLENYKKNGKVNMDTLLWGERFRLNAILQFQNRIAEEYFIDNNLDDVIDDMVKERRHILQSSRGINKELLEMLSLAIPTDRQLTWLELSEIINSTIQKIK